MGFEFIKSDSIKVKSLQIKISDGASYIEYDSTDTSENDRSHAIDLVSLGISHSIFSPLCSLRLTIKDRHHQFMKLNTQLMSIEVKVIDGWCEKYGVQQSSYSRKFKVLNLQKEAESRTQLIMIDAVDAKAFEISKTFSGGAFKTPAGAEEQSTFSNLFKTILGSLGVDVPDANVKSTDDMPRTMKFTPEKNVYENLKENAKNSNMMIYQDNTGFHAKSLVLKDIADISEFTDKFVGSAQVTNPCHFYNFEVLNTAPVQNIQMTQLQDGSSTYIGKMDADTIVDNLVLNNNPDYVKSQVTFGIQQSQEAKAPGAMKLSLSTEMLQNNKVKIYVPGSFYLDNIGRIANLDKKSSAPSRSYRIQGDRLNSGKFLIGKTDYYIDGNLKFYSCLTLMRFDNPAPIQSKSQSVKAAQTEVKKTDLKVLESVNVPAGSSLSDTKEYKKLEQKFGPEKVEKAVAKHVEVKPKTEDLFSKFDAKSTTKESKPWVVRRVGSARDMFPRLQLSDGRILDQKDDEYWDYT